MNQPGPGPSQPRTRPRAERGTHHDLMRARGGSHDMVVRQMESDAREAEAVLG